MGINHDRAQRAQLVQYIRFAARRGDDAQPRRHVLQAARHERHDVQLALAERQRFVEGVDQDIASAVVGCRQAVQGGDQSLIEDVRRPPRNGLRIEQLLELRGFQQIGEPWEPAGDHPCQTHDECRWAKRFRIFGPADMVCQDTAAGIAVDHLGNKSGFSDAGVAGDQQRPFLMGGTPCINFIEEPLPADEAWPLLVQLRGGIEDGQAVIPASERRWLAPGRRFDSLGEAFEAPTVLVLGLRPSRHLNVVQPEDGKRWLAGDGHDRHDRPRRCGEAGEGQFVQADAVGAIEAAGIG